MSVKDRIVHLLLFLTIIPGGDVPCYKYMTGIYYVVWNNLIDLRIHISSQHHYPIGISKKDSFGLLAMNLYI